MLNISGEIILSQILKLGKKEIRSALSLTKEYKVVRIPKKSGGVRTVYIPPEPLKKVQKIILKCLFQKLWGTHWGLYGITKGTSYVKHAQEHKEAKWVFQFDLKDAFPSVNVLYLKEILRKRLLKEIESFKHFIGLYRHILRDLEEAKEKDDEWGIEYYSEEVERYKKKISVSVEKPL